MLARTALRLWAPQYFRGRAGGVGRRLGNQRTRDLDDAVANTRAPASIAPASSPAPATPPAAHPASRACATPPPPSTHSASPIVKRAQELLLDLSCAHQSPQSSAALARAEFSVRQEVLGSLRGSPCVTPARHSGGTASPTAAPHRFRVVADVVVENGADAPPPAHDAATPAAYTLDDLVLFLQLYERVNAEDGQLLAQIMAEVRRRLLTRTRRASTKQPAEPNLEPLSAAEEEALPLPAMLYVMSSLGVVEEAVLDLVTSCAPLDGTPARRGLLYRELRRYSVVELLQLLVALHRFGHHQQPSTKAVTRALRAALYDATTPAGEFHKRARAFKKALAQNRHGATPSHGSGGGAAAGDVPATAEGDTADERSVAAALAADAALRALAGTLSCPLFLLLEALTAATASVHRRADVVTFLSDLAAVTATAELLTAVQDSSRRPMTAPHDFVVAVSHQLLRAAQLTEGMEQPQLLLSEVFAWSTTLSGKGVLVDGGEDSKVPSDRIAYYDHVTADLIKAGRAD